MTPKIYSQSRTNYKQQQQISFRLFLVVLSPRSHSTQLTPMMFLAFPFGFERGKSQPLRENQEIDMNQKMKTHSGYQQIYNYTLHILRPQNTEIGETKKRILGRNPKIRMS